MTQFGAILSHGAHVPMLRLQRATIAAATAWTRPPARGAVHGTRAICNWDEDALTMAVEASRTCLAGAAAAGTAAGVAEVDAIAFCSTTAPFADRDAAVLASAALNLPESVDTQNLGASLRAGTGALISALHRTDGARTLVIASDARLTLTGSPQEMSYGDGASAFLVGPADDTALATVLATRRIGSDFVDHYRMRNHDFDYALEERWVRDESLLQLVPQTTAALLAAAGCRPGDVRHFAVPAGAATAKRIAQACDCEEARRDERVLAECGDAGAALPLLLLEAALEAAVPGELILAVGIGQGVDALLLRAEAGVRASGGRLGRTLGRRRDEPSYVRYLSHRGLLRVDFGMRAERDQRTAQSVAFRKRDAITGFKGGRCSRCGTVQFPPARVCVNPECRATDTQAPYRLAESSGRVKTFTEDWQAYTARPPYVYGNIEFAEGGNLLMEVTDIAAGELQVDDAVRFVFRIKDDDRSRGFRRYFWKATKP